MIDGGGEKLTVSRATLELVVMDAVRNKAEQAMRRKLVGNLLP